jgi:signal transduction histidine kinase
MNAEEDARRQLSRELHDDVNQRLAMLSVDLDSAAQKLPVTDVDLRPLLADIKTRLDKLSDDIDDLAHKFHPPALEEFGLADALESYAHKLAKLRPFSFVVKERNLPAYLPESIATCLYRVGQEALLNSVKHSQSERVRIRLMGTERVVMLSVRDYGTGFDRTFARKESVGLGLIHMEERVRLMGGRFLIRSSPGRGTLVRAWIPLEGSAA